MENVKDLFLCSILNRSYFSKKGFYKNDKKHGEMIIMDDKGSIIGKEIYENDLLWQKLAFYPTGELLKEQLYQNGLESISKTYYRSGKLLEEKYYDEKGTLNKSGRYMEDGSPIATFITKKV